MQHTLVNLFLDWLENSSTTDNSFFPTNTAKLVNRYLKFKYQNLIHVDMLLHRYLIHVDMLLHRYLVYVDMLLHRYLGIIHLT